MRLDGDSRRMAVMVAALLAAVFLGYGLGSSQSFGWAGGAGFAGGGPGRWQGPRGGLPPGGSDLKLTAADVKASLDRIVARRGNPRLKAGEVKEQDADTILADIVTQDNSLVERFLVDRHTGFYRPEEK